jgi:rod shape-determining protein MreD
MFKKILITFAILWLIGIFQSSFLVLFLPSGMTPNLLLIGIVFFISLGGLDNGLIFLILAGIVADIFSQTIFGVNVVSFIFIALVISFLAKRLAVSHSIWKFGTLIFLIVVASYLNEIIINGISNLLGEIPAEKMNFMNKHIWNHIAVNLTIVVLLYSSLEKIVNFVIISYENRNIVIRRT